MSGCHLSQNHSCNLQNRQRQPPNYIDQQMKWKKFMTMKRPLEVGMTV